MQNMTYPVRGKLTKDGKTVKVGEATFVKYDTVAEAVSHMGEEEALKTLNTQVRTNALNAVRQAATKPISQEALRMAATREIFKLPPDQLAALAGDEQALEAKIKEVMSRLEAEDIQKRQQALAAVPQDEGEEDEDEAQA
jgi:hypothetical protein